MGYTKSLAFLWIAMVMVSCNDKSLQKYLVQKQDDPNFVKVDIPASMLEGKTSKFSPEEQEVLQSIKKVNVVAYPIDTGNRAEFELERNELQTILDQDRYKELTRIKSNDWNATLKYTGEEDAIDEVIVFASDETRGFAVFRVLGENMRPDQMLQFMNSANMDKMDFSELEGVFKRFKD